MKAPRKTLGNVNAPACVALKELIDTQSKDTIREWCLGYAADKLLPLYEKHCPGDLRPRNAVDAARDYVDGKVEDSQPVCRYTIDHLEAVAKPPDFQAVHIPPCVSKTLRRLPGRACYFGGGWL